MGTAERISAVVEMNHPGIWILGDLADDDRKRGMGIVVEYAAAKGKPQWTKPFRWDYAQFGKADTSAAKPDETMEFTIVKHNGALNGFNQWTLNGEAFSMDAMKPMYKVHEGRRYERTRTLDCATEIKHASPLSSSTVAPQPKLSLR